MEKRKKIVIGATTILLIALAIGLSVGLTRRPNDASNDAVVGVTTSPVTVDISTQSFTTRAVTNDNSTVETTSSAVTNDNTTEETTASGTISTTSDISTVEVTKIPDQTTRPTTMPNVDVTRPKRL